MTTKEDLKTTDISEMVSDEVHSAEISSEENNHAHHHSHHQHSPHEKPHPLLIGVLVIAGILVILNVIQMQSLAAELTKLPRAGASTGSQLDLAGVDLDTLQSTAHTLAATFPVDQIKTQEDAMTILFPTGVPEYGTQLGVSFDDPVGSLATLARMFESLKAEVQQSNPAAWNRFINLATKPVGISCEYCCGVGPVGISKNGESRCGCQHNPALLSVALYLTAYSDYSDAEILREVMRWKTLFFPKNMIELGMKLGGGDTSVLESLPGMVGGC